MLSEDDPPEFTVFCPGCVDCEPDDD